MPWNRPPPYRSFHMPSKLMAWKLRFLPGCACKPVSAEMRPRIWNLLRHALGSLRNDLNPMRPLPNKRSERLPARLILEQTKSFKKWRFLFSKILIQNENEKILRFDRQRNQKPNFYVCVSVWKKIWIHVCVSDLWTKRNLWFILCSLSHTFFCCLFL